MERLEVAQMKTGQTVTLEFGNREAVLTKLEEPRKFNMADWFDEEEVEVYILEDVIEEDEPLHYCRTPVESLEAALKADEGKFGAARDISDFLGRVVDGMEMEEEEEGEAG
ncbi:MAG: hypothetical protein HQL53_12310 [Magnetococcales bacterium]|nr:hypothetical protein [Magnetococcales bacterium]